MLQIQIVLPLTQKQIAPFCTTNPLRPTMNGVVIRENCLIATDGHILVKYPIEEAEEFEDIILPITAFAKYKKNETVVSMDVEQTSTCTVIERDAKTKVVLETRVVELISGSFPDHKFVWPSDNSSVPVEHICINPAFVAKFAGLCTVESPIIQCTFHGTTSGILITNDNFSGLLMPAIGYF